MTKIILAIATTVSFYSANAWAAALQPQLFAEKVAISDMCEMGAARIEIRSGKSEKLKAFTEEMLKDHEVSTHNLHDAAIKEEISLPNGLDAKLQAKLDAIKTLSGMQLDAAYASAQISVHSEAVTLFSDYAKEGKDGPLKAFAQQTYPTIRMHLVRIKGLNSGE